ncbi:MAG: hypothetical protein IIY78_03370 [Clostridia bacterium]|nr:hypothetical protein [Clostridia bacterium]
MPNNVTLIHTTVEEDGRTTVTETNVINLRLDREHHKVFRQAFFQKGLPPEAYRKLKLMTLSRRPEEYRHRDRTYHRH